MTIAAQLWRGLFRFTSAGDVVPDLVSKWSVFNDGKSYRFELRPASFSNGTPLHSKHVVASIARALKQKSLIASDLNYITGTAEFLKSGKLSALGIVADGDSSLVVRLSSPNALLLKHLAAPDCAVLPVADPAADLDLSSSIGTSGPYRIESLTSESVTLRKWRKDPSDSVAPPERLHFFATDESPLSLALSGKTDSLDKDTLDTPQIESLTKLGWQRSVTELVSERFVIMDPSAIAEKTRRFLFSRIAPKALAAKLGHAGLTAAWGPVPFGLPGSLEEIEREKVRSELATEPEAGSLVLEYTSANPINKAIVAELLDQWKHPALTITTKDLTLAQYFDGLFEKKSPFLLAAKGVDYFDAFSVLGYFRGSNPSNYYRLKNSEIDALLDKASATADSAQRLELYRQVQSLALRQAVVIPLISGSTASGMWSPKVVHVPAHPLGIHTLAFESIELKAPPAPAKR